MKKILILSQIFEIGSDTGSDRHFHFAKHVVKNDHLSEVITANVDYKRASPKIFKKWGSVTREIDGVNIRYVYAYANFRGSFIKRFLYFVTFFFSAFFGAIRVRGVDVVYAISTPLTVGLLGLLISRIKRVPYVFEVTDVWPDAAIACGVVQNPLVIKLAHVIEMLCYRGASHIVALTEGIQENIIGKGIPREKVSIVTNGADFSLFSSEELSLWRSKKRIEYGIGNRFVAMYMGAHGAYNALMTIMDAAKQLRDDHSVIFVLIGDGDEKIRLRNFTEREGLNNVLFIDPVPRIESPKLLSAADCFLLPNRRGDFFQGNLPNKLFDYMAAGKPIVVAGVGETPSVIKAADCGKIVAPEDGLAMAKELSLLAKKSPDELAIIGDNARKYVMRNFDRNVLSDKLMNIIVG